MNPVLWFIVVDWCSSDNNNWIKCREIKIVYCVLFIDQHRSPWYGWKVLNAWGKITLNNHLCLGTVCLQYRAKNTEDLVYEYPHYRNRIHERTISLRLLDIILRVLRLEVFLYNVYIANQFKTTFAQGGGIKIRLNRCLWIARRKTLKTFVPITSKNSVSVLYWCEGRRGVQM